MLKVLLAFPIAVIAMNVAGGAPSQTVDTPVTQQQSSSEKSTSNTDNNVVRLATVTTIQSGGLLDRLIADFEKKTRYRVKVYAGEDVYTQARAGKADVVFSHFGHKDAQAFLQEGFGEWPQAVLSNTMGFIVPPGDPAHVATAKDPVEAFERIAQSKSPFVVNDIEGLKYVTDTLWNAAGKPDKSGWYFDQGLREADAMNEAAKIKAYSFWGVSPFLRYQEKSKTALSPIVLNDSLMQRLMVSVAVNPAKLPGVNEKGAKAFQAYLLDPATQAMIRAFRVQGVPQPLFWPQGRTNGPSVLPNSTAGKGKGKGSGGGSGKGKDQ